MLNLLQAQNQSTSFDNSAKIIHIQKASEIIQLDGNLDESVWKKAQSHSNFWMKSPVNDTLANPSTTVYLTYDHKFLYVGARIEMTKEGNIVQSL